MPAYNAAAYLDEAVRSVLAQTFTNFELLIVDDGSTDATPDLLAAHARSDPRVRVLRQPNRGVVAALNRALAECRGRYVARMDADDVSLPHRLEAQVRYLDTHKDVALVGAYVSTIDEVGEPLSSVVRFPLTHEALWASIGRRKWVMCHPSVMFRREVALASGLYREDFRHAEDVEYFARVMSGSRAATLPEVLLRYRLHRGAVCSRHRLHGRVNAQLVARIVDRWAPGEPFEPTPAERRAADEEIRRLAADRPGVGEAMYWLRVGRELLRDARYRPARRAYLKAARLAPWQAAPYLGLACAFLHVPTGGSRRAPR